MTKQWILGDILYSNGSTSIKEAYGWSVTMFVRVQLKQSKVFMG